MTTADEQGEPSLHDGCSVGVVPSPLPSSRALVGRSSCKGAGGAGSSSTKNSGGALRKPLDFRLFVLAFTVFAALLGTASAHRSNSTTAALTSAALLQIELTEVRLTGPSSGEDAQSFALDDSRPLPTHSNPLLSDRLPDDTDTPAIELEVVDVDVDQTLQDLIAHALPGAVTVLVVSWEDLTETRAEIEVRGDTSRFSIETGLPRGPPSMG